MVRNTIHRTVNTQPRFLLKRYQTRNDESINSIRDMFGAKMALYFVFVDVYVTSRAVPPHPLGILAS